MSFNPPDPEKILKSLERQKQAFRDAADEAVGDAKPLFERLTQKIEKVFALQTEISPENLGPKEIFNIINTLTEAKRAMDNVVKKTQTDPAAKATFDKLLATLKEEQQQLMKDIDLGGMMGGGFPGGGFPGGGGLEDIFGGGFPGRSNPNDKPVDVDPETGKPPRIGPKKKPNGPKDGSFDL